MDESAAMAISKTVAMKSGRRISTGHVSQTTLISFDQ
jgi:hypothetical protein